MIRLTRLLPEAQPDDASLSQLTMKHFRLFSSCFLLLCCTSRSPSPYRNTINRDTTITRWVNYLKFKFWSGSSATDVCVLNVPTSFTAGRKRSPNELDKKWELLTLKLKRKLNRPFCSWWVFIFVRQMSRKRKNVCLLEDFVSLWKRWCTRHWIFQRHLEYIRHSHAGRCVSARRLHPTEAHSVCMRLSCRGRAVLALSSISVCVMWWTFYCTIYFLSVYSRVYIYSSSFLPFYPSFSVHFFALGSSYSLFLCYLLLFIVYIDIVSLALPSASTLTGPLLRFAVYVLDSGTFLLLRIINNNMFEQLFSSSSPALRVRASFLSNTDTRRSSADRWARFCCHFVYAAKLLVPGFHLFFILFSNSHSSIGPRWRSEKEMFAAFVRSQLNTHPTVSCHRFCFRFSLRPRRLIWSLWWCTDVHKSLIIIYYPLGRKAITVEMTFSAIWVSKATEIAPPRLLRIASHRIAPSRCTAQALTHIA